MDVGVGVGVADIDEAVGMVPTRLSKTVWAALPSALLALTVDSLCFLVLELVGPHVVPHRSHKLVVACGRPPHTEIDKPVVTQHRRGQRRAPVVP